MAWWVWAVVVWAWGASAAVVWLGAALSAHVEFREAMPAGRDGIHGRLVSSASQVVGAVSRARGLAPSRRLLDWGDPADGFPLLRDVGGHLDDAAAGCAAPRPRIPPSR